MDGWMDGLSNDIVLGEMKRRFKVHRQLFSKHNKTFNIPLRNEVYVYTIFR